MVQIIILLLFWQVCITTLFENQNDLDPVCKPVAETIFVDSYYCESPMSYLYFLIFQQIRHEYRNFVTTCKGKIKAKENLKCIVVVLMAHGGFGYIKCYTDTFDEVKLELKFFFDLLERCSELREIPKIFIIEACRKQSGMIHKI